MEEIKPNSNKYKEQQKQNNTEIVKRTEKVVKGNVKVKQKSALSKMAGEIISEDAKNVKTYVLRDVLIPALKKAISDIVTDGIDIILYGESRRGSKKSGYADRVSYRSYYDRDERPRRERDYIDSRSYSYNDIRFESRADAEDVLERMDEMIETYGLVRVADLYDLAGITGEYTDNNYGWTSLRNVEIMRARDGFSLRLPKAMPIER